MEIYTGDFITIAQEYADKINKKINYTGYVVEDECCNLQKEIREKIYERLTIAFNDLIENDFNKNELKDKLFKIINEL